MGVVEDVRRDPIKFCRRSGSDRTWQAEQDGRRIIDYEVRPATTAL